jgi:hypothetical protein
VFTVSVEVCVVVPLICTELGEKLHVGGSLAAVGVMEQLRLTVPEKPFIPSTLMVPVLPVVAPGVIVMEVVPPLPTVKLGSAVTVRAMVVDAVSVPEVPVMVTVTVLEVTSADVLAVTVSTCVPAAVPAAKEAVTPLGRPAAARETVPEKLPTTVTVIVLVPLLSCATETLAGEADSVKLGAAATVKATIVDSLNVPEVPVMVTLTGPPTVAELVAVSVIALEPAVVGLGLNAAVTPLGRPEAEKVTLPENPLAGVTVMVSMMLVLS